MDEQNIQIDQISESPTNTNKAIIRRSFWYALFVGWMIAPIITSFGFDEWAAFPGIGLMVLIPLMWIVSPLLDLSNIFGILIFALYWMVVLNKTSQLPTSSKFLRRVGLYCAYAIMVICFYYFLVYMGIKMGSLS